MNDHGTVPRLAHDDAYQLFRSTLTDLRRKKGVTQSDLAELLGVPQSYVSKYELGERRVDLVETYEICRALDTDLATFVRKVIKTIESKRTRGSASPSNGPRTRR